jgi:hypothetical protein
MSLSLMIQLEDAANQRDDSKKRRTRAKFVRQL